MCLNVPLAVYFSGNLPLYADVSLPDFSVELKSIEHLLPNVAAVIAVHGYGSICRIREIIELASKHGLFVIEDACLAQGGYCDGVPAGAFGIASVVSFGSGKPITLGHGGAILTDDSTLFRELRGLARMLPQLDNVKKNSLDKMNQYHTNLYNKYYGRNLYEHVGLFRQKALSSRYLFSYAFDQSVGVRLEYALENLSNEIRIRWDKLMKFVSELTPILGEKAKICIPPSGSVPWRLNILVPHRDRIMRAIHELGLPASSWHPPAHEFLGEPYQVGLERPISKLIGEKILNLWIDKNCTAAYRKQVINILKNLAS